MAKPNGVVIYQGPSQIDGQTIAVIVTGIGKASRNEKTGDMLQTWIIRDDVAPNIAVHMGADASVCGDCKHRGTIVNGRNVNRSCYVTVGRAPRQVYLAYRKGNYPVALAHQIADCAVGRVVRLGSYGDPAAVPLWVWEAFTSKALTWTGYTHQWRNCSPDYARYCMASVDTACEQIAAKMQGYRTFRVRAANEDLAAREIVCPASEEAGKRTSCADCRACGGLSAKARVDIAIMPHGLGKGNFRKAA